MSFVVAIDGPAGAGKSTVARRVALELGFTYIDTGAMYRAVALATRQQGVADRDEAGLVRLAQQLRIVLSPLSEDGKQRVSVDDKDVTDAIRTPEVSQLTSAVSALPALRREVVALQRRMAQEDEHGVVLEGRDIGTVVFPDAQVKVFLTASADERARRRTSELRARGLDVDEEQVLTEQQERDTRDSERAASPLIAEPPDAVILNTDGLTVEEVFARILNLCRQREEQGKREEGHAKEFVGVTSP